MRLPRLDHGHRLRHKLLMAFIGLVSDYRVPDVVRTLFYRPEFFGRRYNALLQEVMRGPSEWSVGHRELFAAFVSRENQCVF